MDNTGNTSHHRVAPLHASSIFSAWRQKQMKAAALPQTLPLPLIRHLRMITLNYFMKRSVMIQVRKIQTFLYKLQPPGFKKKLHTSTTSTANLKWHIKPKHLASLSRWERIKNQKTWQQQAKSDPLPPKSH